MKTQSHHSPITTARTLTATAILFGSVISLHAGETTAGKSVVEKAPPSNPLCFLDGKVCFDLQDRLRWEVRENNFDFNDDSNALTDDNWLLQRFRIGVAVKPTPWLKLYAQGQDSREINSDRPDFPGVLGAEGDDAFDLRQGYVELGNPKDFPLTLKVGRQVLSYGDERLIGASDWNNLGRTFDAVRFRNEQPTWWLEAFASTVVVPKRGSYNQSDLFNGNENERAQVFSGLYFSTSALDFQTTDFYALYLHEDSNPRFLPTARGDTDFATLGGRAKSKPGKFHGFDYEAEMALQLGQVRGLDLTAFAAHVGGGYTFDAPWKPRLGLEYSYATGDGDPTDGDIATFQNLFPTNHKFYGYMDLFSWQNIHNPAFSLKAAPCKKVTAQVDYHAFWLATTDDAWYRANGITTVRPLTPAARSASNFVGHEIDVTVTWNACTNFQMQAGYSHFFAGDYLADTGPSDDADFGYIQATVTF